MIDVEDHREQLLRDLPSLPKHLEIKGGRVQAERVEELRPEMIADVHRGVDRQLEEPDPEPVPAGQDVRIGPHQGGERLAMSELIVTPVLEPLEDRVPAPFRVLFELPEDRDVSGVADLRAQVGGVVDELRLEVGVLLGLGQERQVDPDLEVLEGVVDEAGMAALVRGVANRTEAAAYYHRHQPKARRP